MFIFVVNESVCDTCKKSILIIVKVKKKKEKDAKEGEGISATPASSNPVTAIATPNFESLQQKFAKLSYFDQHQVTSQCTAAVLDQIKSFTAGNFTYLPLGDNISFLFDLMQQALNISGLLDFIIRVSFAQWLLSGC